jgi:hypothetical protein
MRGLPPGRKRASKEAVQVEMVAPALKSSSTVNAPMSGGPAGTVVVVEEDVVVEDDVDVLVVVPGATVVVDVGCSVLVVVPGATVVVVVPGATVVVVVTVIHPSSQAAPSRAMVVARAATMRLEPSFIFESVIEVFSFLKAYVDPRRTAPAVPRKLKV